VVDVNTNVWKGVSSAGISWSFDAEGAEVSDDSLTSMTQPSVTVYTARGFVPFSIEVSQDWEGFTQEMQRLLAAGYDELVFDKFTRGTGSGQPYGIRTVLETTSSAQVTSTTDGSFGQEDVYKVWAALGIKYRRNASWMMSIDINNRIAQFGTSTQLHAVTTQLGEGQVDRLRTRPVYVNDYFPSYTGTTGAETRLVVGDFSNFVIARRAGLTTELVPILVSTGSARPTGQRGFFSWARVGSNVASTSAFKILLNT
jgi:HK97 family phage major capsid protein